MGTSQRIAHIAYGKQVCKNRSPSNIQDGYMGSTPYSVPPPPPPPGKPRQRGTAIKPKQAPSGTGLCALCMTSVPQHEMVDYQGKRICEACSKTFSKSAAPKVPEAVPVAAAPQSETEAVASPESEPQQRVGFGISVKALVLYGALSLIVVAGIVIWLVVTKDPYGRTSEHVLGAREKLEQNLMERGLTKALAVTITQEQYDQAEKKRREAYERKVAAEQAYANANAQAEEGGSAPSPYHDPVPVSQEYDPDPERQETCFPGLSLPLGASGFGEFYRQPGTYHLFADPGSTSYQGVVVVHEAPNQQVRGVAVYWFCEDLTEKVRVLEFVDDFWTRVAGAEPVLIDRPQLLGRDASFVGAKAAGIWLKRLSWTAIHVVRTD
ncbi:MAG: hypothetical protein L6R28_01215 [Planctomycetes bacterium]|nr:hypothetical protein [Planctomycetota bacterium]